MYKSIQVDDWLKCIQGWVYPPRCLLCGAPGVEGRDLCAACLLDLPHNPVACLRCGLPLAGHEDGLCGACLNHPPRIDSSIIPFRYASPLDHLLLGLKFNRQLINARLLGKLMANEIVRRGELQPDAILPVPLHRERLHERGFNQALELARPIAKRLALPLRPELAMRTAATAAQSSLERRARRQNIRGVFSASEGLPAHIAIVDDVVTTGSTVNELAKVLRRAGAERVVVWACARVPSGL